MSSIPIKVAFDPIADRNVLEYLDSDSQRQRRIFLGNVETLLSTCQSRILKMENLLEQGPANYEVCFRISNARTPNLYNTWNKLGHGMRAATMRLILTEVEKIKREHPEEFSRLINLAIDGTHDSETVFESVSDLDYKSVDDNAVSSPRLADLIKDDPMMDEFA